MWKNIQIDKYINQEGISYTRKIGSFPLTINTEGPQIQGTCFKSGDWLWAHCHGGQICRNKGDRSRDPSCAYMSWKHKLVEYITLTVQLKYGDKLKGSRGRIFTKTNPKCCLKMTQEEQEKKIRVYTSLWKINPVNLKNKTTSASPDSLRLNYYFLWINTDVSLYLLIWLRNRKRKPSEELVEDWSWSCSRWSCICPPLGLLP